MKVTDDDGFLTGSLMLKAKNTIMKERIWINHGASEFVFLPQHPDTGALLHDERVIAPSSTSEMSLMECGRPGNFLLTWSRRVSERSSQLRGKSNSQYSLLLDCASIQVPSTKLTTKRRGLSCWTGFASVKRTRRIVR